MNMPITRGHTTYDFFVLIRCKISMSPLFIVKAKSTGWVTYTDTRYYFRRAQRAGRSPQVGVSVEVAVGGSVEAALAVVADGREAGVDEQLVAVRVVTDHPRRDLQGDVLLDRRPDHTLHRVCRK